MILSSLSLSHINIMLGVTYLVAQNLLSFSVLIIYRKMAFYYLGLPEILCKSVRKGMELLRMAGLEECWYLQRESAAAVLALLRSASRAELKPAQGRMWAVKNGLLKDLGDSASQGEWFGACNGLGFHYCCARWRDSSDMFAKAPMDGWVQTAAFKAPFPKRLGHF